MIATATPISSPTGAVGCSAWSTIWPLRETVDAGALGDRRRPSASRSPGARAELAGGLVVLDRA